MALYFIHQGMLVQFMELTAVVYMNLFVCVCVFLVQWSMEFLHLLILLSDSFSSIDCFSAVYLCTTLATHMAISCQHQLAL